MGIFGSLIKLGFGGPPDLEAWQAANAQDSQLKSVKGNSAILPETISQAGKINDANMAMIDKMYNLVSGGWYKSALNKVQKNTTDFLNGGDLRDVLAGSAASNLYRGVAGSRFGELSTLQRTADEVTKNKMIGADSFNRWLAGVQSAYQPVSVGRMFEYNSISPQYQAGYDVSERDKKLNYTNMKNQFEYANDPMRGVEDSVAQIGDMVGTALMAYMGGGIGGMGAMGGAAGGAGGGGMMSMLGGGGGGMGLSSIMSMFGGGGGSTSSKASSIASLASQTQYMPPW